MPITSSTTGRTTTSTAAISSAPTRERSATAASMTGWLTMPQL